ncbi:(d)CMP kinase [Blattabacterium cuenoti]|uniref:(d)CMP kinase n=1 Tax=Blattabacterium cuenoti TaxID=1653831 RepID=UPI00163CD54B|nr:(d)CMP kinase [Blattabacterium cuenoti]
MNQNKKTIIAIDGYSSSGKSTLAQKISKELKFNYIDTGAMYRSVALLAIQKNVFNSDLWNSTNFIPILKEINFQFKWNKILNKTDFFLNKKNVLHEIRSKRVTNKVSLIARIPKIRDILTTIIKKFIRNVSNKGIVIDGRDIGNIVYPQSELKIFMTGSIEIRSYRRFQEIQKRGGLNSYSYEEIKKNILYRDRMDTSRKISPLKKSLDSIEIDNTFLSPEKQLTLVLKVIENIKNNRKKIKKII